VSISLSDFFAQSDGRAVRLVSGDILPDGTVAVRPGLRGDTAIFSVDAEKVTFEYSISTPTNVLMPLSTEWIGTGLDHDAGVEAVSAALTALGWTEIARQGGTGDGGDTHYANTTLTFRGRRPPVRGIVVGRHAGDIPGVEIVESRNIEWSLDPIELGAQWRELENAAMAAKAAVVLQNVPGVLAGYLMLMAHHEHIRPNVYVVISRPGPRQAGISRTWVVSDDPYIAHAGQSAAEQAATVAGVAAFANGRAKVTTDLEDHRATVTVTVDPVAAFEFVRLERVW